MLPQEKQSWVLLGLGGPKASPGALALGLQTPSQGALPLETSMCLLLFGIGGSWALQGGSRDIFKAHFQGAASQPQWPGLRTPGPGLPLRE